MKSSQNVKKELSKVRKRSVQKLTPQKITKRGGGLQEKNVKKVPLLIQMFEKMQGASEGNLKTQPKTENFKPPFEAKLKLTMNLEPSPKLTFVDPPSEKINPTKPEAKKSSQNSIKNYFRSSNFATNTNPDAMTTSPIRS